MTVRQGSSYGMPERICDKKKSGIPFSKPSYLLAAPLGLIARSKYLLLNNLIEIERIQQGQKTIRHYDHDLKWPDRKISQTHRYQTEFLQLKPL